MKRLFLLILLSFFVLNCGDDDSDSGIDSDTDTDTDTDSDTDTNTEEEIEWDYFEDFESYSPGDFIMETVGYPWGTFWDTPPLPGADPQVSDEAFYSPKKSLHFVEDNEVVLWTEITKGRWLVEFEMLLDDEKLAAYSFVQKTPNDSDFDTGFWAYFYPDGNGTIFFWSEDSFKFTFDPDDWFTVSHDLDIDNDTITLTVDGIEIHTWPWALWTYRFDGILYWGYPDPPGADFFVDDIRYREL